MAKIKLRIIHLILIFITNIQRILALNKTNAITEPKIIGGQPATSLIEYQVSIRLKSYERVQFGLGHICGGSLISNEKILTAAHCMFKFDQMNNIVYLRGASEFKIVMGILNLYDKQNAIERNVKSFAYHKSFNLKTMQNDIAVMVIDRDLVFHPIPINKFFLNEETQNCQISGWGRTSLIFGNSSPSTNLMVANVSIVNQETCKTNYRRIGQAVSNGMFCAGYLAGKTDSCQGDSGGPLVCNNTLVGIVSWGRLCAQPNYPGIYTNVSYYYKWINTNRSARYFNHLNQIFSVVLIFLLYVYV